MRPKKVLTSLLVFASALALSSCGGGGGGGDYDPSNFLPNGTPENPYQIVKEPVTIKIFAPHSAGYPEYNTLKMFKHLSKITNLIFDFTTPDTSAYTASRAAVWQSGPIPDMFLFNNSMSEIVQFVENQFNAYVPLSKDDYSYNFPDLLNAIKSSSYYSSTKSFSEIVEGWMKGKLKMSDAEITALKTNLLED